MPFVTYDNIKELIPSGLKSELSKSDVFTVVEAEAAKIINQTCGETIPATVTDAPAWVLLPAAYIITKIASIKLVSSPEFQSVIDKNFDYALELLRQKVVKGTTTDLEYSKSDAITSIIEW